MQLQLVRCADRDARQRVTANHGFIGDFDDKAVITSGKNVAVSAHHVVAIDKVNAVTVALRPVICRYVVNEQPVAVLKTYAPSVRVFGPYVPQATIAKTPQPNVEALDRSRILIGCVAVKRHILDVKRGDRHFTP